jgi:hypothetical protein
LWHIAPISDVRFRAAFEGIVLQNSKMPPQQNSRESEFIASFG